MEDHSKTFSVCFGEYINQIEAKKAIPKSEIIARIKKVFVGGISSNTTEGTSLD
jgi:hypothetical protein